MADRIRVALEFEIEAGRVAIDALELPFYRGLRTGPEGQPVENGEFVYELIQVGLPVDIDFLGLKRWCFFLWDGETDLIALDGLSSTIHELNESIGIDLDSSGSAISRDRAATYLAFFCAFLVDEFGKENGSAPFGRYLSPFPLMSGPSSRGWVPAAREAIAKAAVGSFPEILIERPVAPSLDEFTGASAGPDGSAGERKREFISAPITESARALVCLYGPSLHRAQFRLVFRNPRDGKWRNGEVVMVNDGDATSPDRLPPLFVKSWHRRVAFFCAREGPPPPDEVSIRPELFGALATDPDFLPAARGVPGAFERVLDRLDEADRAAVGDLLRLLAIRHWGGGLGERCIRIAGDLELASPGEEIATAIDLDAPIRVDGHLVFVGATFRAPVRLANWRIGGRVNGSGASALRSLTLANFRVENGIGRVAADRPGRIEYPDNAIKLDELRVEGTLDLKSLHAQGGLSLRRANVGGRLTLARVRLGRHRVSGKPGALSAGHAVVGGSLDAEGLAADGELALSNARIGGDVDLSGAWVARPHGVVAKSLSAGGDLHLNRYRGIGGEPPHIPDLAPTLIGGTFDAENATVEGSVYACHCHVLGNLDFRGADIGHNLTLYGVHGAGGLPPWARATIVLGEISAYGARVGGCVNIDGTICSQIEFNFLRAEALFVYPGTGSGLPLAVVPPAQSESSEPAEPPVCMHMSHARIGGVFAEGVQLGSALRAINMRIDGDFRLRVARRLAASIAAQRHVDMAPLEFAWRVALLAASDEPALPTVASAHAGLRAFAAEAERLGNPVAAVDDPEEAFGALACKVDGDVRLDGLDCGGNLDLGGIHARHVSLNGVRIANALCLADDRPAASGARRARIGGGLCLRNATVGGETRIDHCDAVGEIDVRDAELAGGLRVIDCRLEAASAEEGGPTGPIRAALRVNNVRTRSDLVLAGVHSQTCEIGECVIGGDLAIGRGSDAGSSDADSSRGGRTSFDDLRIVATRIDGELALACLDVEDRIDLTDSRSGRGLRVASGQDVSCLAFDMTRFATEADVELPGLLCGQGGQFHRANRTGAGATRSVGRWLSRLLRRLPRYWDDLTLPEEPMRSRLAGLDLVARHAQIGGEFLLPVGDGVMRTADLAFANADRVEVTGCAFSGFDPKDVALCLRGANFQSALLAEPLPRRVDLREASVAHWDIKSAGGRAAASSTTYLDFVHRSWPYTQAAYTKLEQDYRDGGQHKDADYFLAAAGWRTWRWSMIRPAFDGWGVKLLILLAGVLAAVTALRFGIGWGAATLVVVGTVHALLSPIHDVFKRASRSLIGLFIVAPFQLLYGFGIRWWLPLVLSAVLLLTVTLPVMSDCRNLQVPGVDASMPRTAGAAPGAEGSARGPANRTSLLAALGADIAAGPEVELSCGLRPANASAQEAPRVDWNLGEALWLALRYHLPVVPIDAFFHGERAESVRPSSGPLHLAWAGSDGAHQGEPIEWVSPIAYARAVYLLSWLVIPFSLIFAAARIQRKFRLQKD
ncbi:hypothetical protein [Zeimonas arvi]|uniref:Membrane-associated oxidoreductase n=1 Tax=Zeimonas arvi TaxID=2498847 RepID=A0A5C8NWK3_9BURK|nr:hypothetical protein [Zeimonas arvi]TXL65523.1 hypothetical protein FHP08_12155 [Zeimonas arvi]